MPFFSHIHIAYGSESGRAEQLAQQLLQQPCLAAHPHSIASLNNTHLEQLPPHTLLLIVTSSFGDGEAPANADQFANYLENLPACHISYAIFGLGDTSYDKFCGYSKHLDHLLQCKHATAIIERVDADLNYQAIFQQWLNLLIQALANPITPPLSHSLSVKVYAANQTYAAQVLDIQQLAQSAPAVFHLRLSLKESGIFYQAGDLIYLQAPNADSLLAEFCHWFNDSSAKEVLQQKELRLLNKNILRDVAKICDSTELKALTKIANKKALEDYLYGHDLLDLLRDFDPEHRVSLQDLHALLPNLTARAYSISSCGQTHPEYVDLCVREVSYQLGERHYYGTASHYIAQCQAGDFLPIFAKSNPTFHLTNKQIPIVMIGAGTGIAPYIGFLQALQREQRASSHYLFFGERHRLHDFLYQNELEQYLHNGTLTKLFTAFSRDQAEKVYVQDLLKQQAELIWQLIQQGAYFYVCGSKKMSKAIDESLLEIAERIGHQPYIDDFNNIVAHLVAEGRLLRDIY
ncbi:diflavin oxidoreductase [Bibersteinia trehalosi]|uniref:diflavin oxidoreductase n=1 Tax=Bibersteinia trehalosi TaxID=47735 RepID=UPI004045C413